MPQLEVGQSPTALSPRYIPDTVIDREPERSMINNALASPESRNLYLHGPRGTGKSVVIRHVLRDVPDTTTTCYLSCRSHYTQYKVLHRLYEALSGTSVNSGFHASDLQRLIEQRLTGNTIVVLDDIDLLLANDGNDLLYWLSRLDIDQETSIVGISSNTTDLAARIDERTRSSLQPLFIEFDPYSEDQARRILEERITGTDRISATSASLDTIVSRTTNTRLGLHWVVVAAQAGNGQITEELVEQGSAQAIQRYQDVLLEDFSSHHRILLEAIHQLVVEQDEVYTGEVYERYDKLTAAQRRDPLTHRRISDFLTHLELLGIIQVKHFLGGDLGRTRRIQLAPLFQQLRE